MPGELIVEGGSHKHVDPDYCGFPAYNYGWNTVVKSECGHYYVRRYTYIQMLIPLSDHFPEWRRLRPYHIGALLRMLFRRR